MNKKGRAIRIVLVLIAFNAGVGVFTLLGGRMNETSGKVLATSLLATLAALLTLVCAPHVHRHGIGLVAELGILGAWAASGMFVAALWTETESTWWLKTAGTAEVTAGAAAIACLLAAWHSHGGLGWVAPASQVLVGVAGAMLMYGIWTEPRSGFWRLFGVVAVLLAAGVVATPIVHRLETPPPARMAEPFGFCPFCGSAFHGQTGSVAECATCRSRFEITVRSRGGVRHPVA